jgi:hypothetical protein
MVVVVVVVVRVQLEASVISVAIVITMMKIVIRIPVEALVLEVVEIVLVVMVMNFIFKVREKDLFLARGGQSGGGAFRTGNDGNSRGNFNTNIEIIQVLFLFLKHVIIVIKVVI